MPKKPVPAFEMYIDQGFCKTPKEVARAIREVARKLSKGPATPCMGTVYNKFGDGCGAFRFEMGEE